MNSETVPLKYLCDVSRDMVDPQRMGEQTVFHYSLPAWHEFGSGVYEAASSLASGKLLLSGSEILVSKLNPEKGAVIQAEPHVNPTLCSPEFIALVPRRLLSRYLYYLMLAKPMRDALQSTVESVTSSHKRARVDRFLSTQVQFPDLATQKAVADFLDRETDRVEKLIEKKRQLVALLKVRQQALLESLIKGQATTGSEMRSSEIDWIGQVPAHWLVPRINQVARLESGHTPSRSKERYWVAEECTIPWFTLGDIWQVRQEGRVYVSSTQEKISPIGMANSAARLLPADTVILSRTASVGFPAILRVPMATTQDFVNWISGPQLRPKFLYYVFRAMRREFDRLMIGSTHKTIYMPDVRKFSTPLPSLSEQDEIVHQLDRTLEEHEQLIAKTESAVAILAEYRASVITAAVSGQLDIFAWAKRGETERRLEAVEATV